MSCEQVNQCSIYSGLQWLESTHIAERRRRRPADEKPKTTHSLVPRIRHRGSMLSPPACLHCGPGRPDNQHAGWPGCSQVLHLPSSHLLDQLLLSHCQLGVGVGQVIILGGQQDLQGTRLGQLQEL